jgi:hypothetical protein
MELRIDVPCASENEVKRAIEAAWAVFKKNGTTPEEAAGARFAFEVWDVNGFDEALAPTKRQGEIVDVWDRADEAAACACHLKGASANLQLWSEEIQRKQDEQKRRWKEAGFDVQLI